MASPQLRPKTRVLVPRDWSSESAALRLLSAERPEEIFPILLEEIVKLGFARALVLEVDFETGEIKPAASLNCDKAYLHKFRTSLWASENPVVSALQNLQPSNLDALHGFGDSWYAYPMIYRSASRCWEAERERRQDCLALQNFRASKKLQFEEQVCHACGMQGYATLVLAELQNTHPQKHLERLHALTERANGYLTRLFKFEHYYNRMRDMEGTISRLQAVMQSMADPVILTDNQHRVIIQNRAAERFFRVPEGVSEGGRRAVELNNLLFSAALSSMVVSATDASRDLTLVDVMEGEEVLFEAASAPTSSKDGARTGMVTVMRDVTDLRRADEAIRANLEKLRAAEEMVRQDRDRLNLVIENVGDPIIVADNSAKIVLVDVSAGKKLGQVQMERRMLEMEKFAATGRRAEAIAHEINDPLEAMKNAIHLLSGKLDPPLQPIFDALKTENERVTRIVRQMLGLYRNTAPLGSFDLNSVVEDTLALFARPLAKTGVQVDKRLGELPAMKGSADQFRQLLSNLVVNSRDSLQTGGKLVIKTQEVLARDGLHGWIKLIVADTGSGIAPELQKSMFEPFVSTKGEKGTGLGLWIVKGIVENHNGRIRVRSSSGKGTVFNLTFPIVRPVAVSPLK